MLPLSISAQLSQLEEDFDDDIFDDFDRPQELDSSTRIQALNAELVILRRDKQAHIDRTRLAENKLETVSAKNSHEVAMLRKTHNNTTSELEERIRGMQHELDSMKSNAAFLQHELETSSKERPPRGKGGRIYPDLGYDAGSSSAIAVRESRSERPDKSLVRSTNSAVGHGGTKELAIGRKKRRMDMMDGWGEMLPRKAARALTELNELHDDDDFPDFTDLDLSRQRSTGVEESSAGATPTGDTATAATATIAATGTTGTALVPHKNGPKAKAIKVTTNSSWKHVQNQRYSEIVQRYYAERRNQGKAQLSLPFYISSPDSLGEATRAIFDALHQNLSNINHFKVEQPAHNLYEADTLLKVLNSLYCTVIPPGKTPLGSTDVKFLCEWVTKCRLLSDTRPLWEVGNEMPERASKGRGNKPEWMEFESLLVKKSFLASGDYQADICYSMYAIACRTVRFLRTYTEHQYNSRTRGPTRDTNVSSLVKMCLFLNKLTISTLRCDSMDILCTLISEYRVQDSSCRNLESDAPLELFSPKLEAPTDRFYCVGFDLNVKGLDALERPGVAPAVIAPWSAIVGELKGRLVTSQSQFQILACRKVMRLYYLLWKHDFPLVSESYSEPLLFCSVVETLARSMDNYPDVNLSLDCIRVLSLLRDDDIPQLTRRLFTSCLGRLESVDIPEWDIVKAMV